MRIALVHPFHWSDVRRGGERYFADLAQWLAARGHDVDVVTGTWHEPTVEHDNGVTVHRVSHVMRRRLEQRRISVVETFGWAARRVLRSKRWDVVHATTPTSVLAARLARQRTLMTALGHPTPEQFGGRPFDRQLSALAFRFANTSAAFSAASAAQIRAMFGTDCVVLPLGVRLAEFAPRVGPATGAPRLLFAGFPGETRKGVDLALRAMPAVLDRHPDARLLLPGERSHHERFHASLGTDRDRVLAATDDLGVLPMEQMPALYRSATVSFLPSKWEALGISLAESLACGTPAVCSDDGGMPSIVSRPDVGVVVPTGDVAALARGLIDAIALAAKPETAARCREHAHNWDWDENVGPQHERLYARMSGLTTP